MSQTPVTPDPNPLTDPANAEGMSGPRGTIDGADLLHPNAVAQDTYADGIHTGATAPTGATGATGGTLGAGGDTPSGRSGPNA